LTCKNFFISLRYAKLFLRKNNGKIHSAGRVILFIVGWFIASAACAEAVAGEKDARLIQAAEKGRLSEVQTLLAEGADVHATSIKNISVFSARR